MVGAVTVEMEYNSCNHIFKAGSESGPLTAWNGSESQVMSIKVLLKEWSSLCDPIPCL